MKKATVRIWLCLLICSAIGIGTTIFLRDRNAVYIRDAAGRGVPGANVSVLALWNRFDQVSASTDEKGRADFGSRHSIRGGKFLSVKVTKANDLLYDGVVEVPKIRQIVVAIDPLSKKDPIYCGSFPIDGDANVGKSPGR